MKFILKHFNEMSENEIALFCFSMDITHRKLKKSLLTMSFSNNLEKIVA